MAAEVPGDSLGDDYKGYAFKITGGNDKQGFPMLQGVLTNQRVRLLFSKGMKTFRERRKGCRKRKSVRGCVVGPDLSVLNLIVAQKGEKEIEGLTDSEVPRRLGPKRASKLRALFGLTMEDDLYKYVVKRKCWDGSEKVPRIQRLVTEKTKARREAQRQAVIEKVMRNREDQKEWEKRHAEHKAEKREQRALEVAKKKAAKAAREAKAAQA